MDFSSSIHQWSKTLPSFKVLEPGEGLKKLKKESRCFPERDLEHCSKIQAQPSTGRLYLETDIDQVRRLDDLEANSTLEKEKKDGGREKSIERGTENRRESLWKRDRGMEKGKEKDKGGEKPWVRYGGMERGREKEKKGMRANPEPSRLGSSYGRSSTCPVFSWPEGFPRISYRSTSLPRPVINTVSIELHLKLHSVVGLSLTTDILSRLIVTLDFVDSSTS